MAKVIGIKSWISWASHTSIIHQSPSRPKAFFNTFHYTLQPMLKCLACKSEHGKRYSTVPTVCFPIVPLSFKVLCCLYIWCNPEMCCPIKDQDWWRSAYFADYSSTILPDEYQFMSKCTSSQYNVHIACSLLPKSVWSTLQYKVLCVIHLKTLQNSWVALLAISYAVWFGSMVGGVFVGWYVMTQPLYSEPYIYGLLHLRKGTIHALKSYIIICRW